ncbi:lectin like domain-containing protein [uncultured Methanobrevibacter sp.]|uniref:lectin like domain-containing protein n=1 Tax=uncultured Methanobrevibacter sp. TaxID=253161 RepID=UPI0025EF602C|nr:lectin like domain-containing protein [uncultured Methanobrevibacter sp.]
MSCVSANNDTSDMATFSDLQNQIDNVEVGQSISLTENYFSDNSTSEIKINKSIAIEGNGHYLDALIESRILNFTSAHDIVLHNITFKNGFSSGNGGAVYLTKSTNISFVDCTFINNSATCGGAVFLDYSNVQFVNCSFINNAAQVAGAVFVEYSVTDFKDSLFINNNVFNASGAIYSLCAVNSIDGCGFINNSVNAKTPFGGAIAFIQYEHYISNSKFINNSISGEYGFENNTCMGDEDIIYTTFWPMVFDKVLDDSYELPATYDSRNVTLENGTNVSYVSPVKNQLNTGTCWAFASVSALETYLLIHENKLYNFSENNQKNIMGKYAEHGWVLVPNFGGGTEKTLAYWSRWSGPVNDSDDPFNPASIISPTDLPVVKHVQDVVFLPVMDNDQLKRAILEYGSVVIGYKMHDSEIYMINGTYYYSEISPFNSLPTFSSHAVALVGWDDNYLGSKFGENIPDGAFILKNSYGESAYVKKLNATVYEEAGGYNYISYYDMTLSKENIPFAVVNLEDVDNYRENYFYDYKGSLVNLGFNNETAWFANQFKSNNSNPLAAFSLYTFSPDSLYESFIYVNDNLAYTQKGTIHNPGYNTIKLDELVDLNANDIFKVVVKLTTPNLLYPIAIECDVDEWIANVSTDFNQSFVSPDGVVWYDLHSNNTVLYKGFASALVYYNLSNAHVCLKAFTANILDTVITSDNLTFKALENHSIAINLAGADGSPVSDENVYVNIVKSDNLLLNKYNLTTDSEGNVYIDVSKFYPGTYDVLFSFEGNRKYAKSNNATKLTIIPLKTHIVAEISKLDDACYLVEGYVFDENSNPVLSGQVAYSIFGETHIVELNNSYFSFIINSNNVTIEFLEGSYYLSSNINLTYSDNSNGSKENLHGKFNPSFSKNASGNPVFVLLLVLLALPLFRRK